MKVLKVRNISRGTELGHKVQVASSILARTIGLMLTPSLAPGEGMWLTPCKSVHTLFMRYPIDILYVDPHGTVLDRKTMSTWRMSPWRSQSHGVLELPAGTAERTGTRPGDLLEMKAAD